MFPPVEKKRCQFHITIQSLLCFKSFPPFNFFTNIYCGRLSFITKPHTKRRKSHKNNRFTAVNIIWSNHYQTSCLLLPTLLVEKSGWLEIQFYDLQKRKKEHKKYLLEGDGVFALKFGPSPFEWSLFIDIELDTCESDLSLMRKKITVGTLVIFKEVLCCKLTLVRCFDYITVQ